MEAVASDLTASQEGANGNEVVSDVAMETAVPSHEVAEKRPNEVDQAEDPPEKKVKMAEQDDQPMTEEVPAGPPTNGETEATDDAGGGEQEAPSKDTITADSVVADESDVIVPVVAATGESSPAGDSIAAPENDAAEKETAPEAATTEEDGDGKGSKRSPELTKLWKTVEANPADFTGWTYLLQHVDGVDVELGREAYDAFLFRYPYCYGYWKKYADLEKKKGTKENCMMVFERGIKAIPLSADLWIHYINHVKNEYADQPDFIRAQYERAVGGCGREWKSDKLWDHYVKWEVTISKINVLKLYDRILKNQTQGLSHQFDMFREFVKDNLPKDILPELTFLEKRKEILEAVKEKAKDDEKPAELTVEEENQAIKENVIFERRKFFKETEEKVQARWKFEDNIKRPYFHMKSLERSQLKNWSEYLRVESERNQETAAVEVLYERCMIACALYEEFWLKYVDWLEGLKAKVASESPDNVEQREDLTEKIRDVFTRACLHHLPSKIDIHLEWSAFEERQGDIDKAAEILANLEKAHPQMLNIQLRRINLERRRSNHSEVQELFKGCVDRAATGQPGLATELSIKYARYLRLAVNDHSAALEVLNEALVRDPKNPKLHLQMLDIHLHQWPVHQANVVGVFDNALSKETSLPPKHRLLFLQRKLDYLEDFGDSIADVTKAQAEVAKLRVEIKDAESKSYGSDNGKERRRSRDDVSSSNSKSSSKATHSVNGSSGGGGTTYAATSTNSASYGAHHTSQYQQYGSRYSGASAPPPSTASYPASGYSQYGSSYYRGYYQQ